MALKIPYSIQLLEATLQKILVRGKDRLSDLFLVILNDEEADFVKELPDKLIKELKLNLKTFAFHEALTRGRDNMVENFNTFISDLPLTVDTNKIRVFFLKPTNPTAPPKSGILSKRVFNYPSVGRVSGRVFQTLDGVPSHIKSGE